MNSKADKQILFQPQEQQQHNPNDGVIRSLLAWFESFYPDSSRPVIKNPKLQSGKCVQDDLNSWWYTIHPKTSRLIFADSEAELQKMIHDRSVNSPTRRPSSWF